MQLSVIVIVVVIATTAAAQHCSRDELHIRSAVAAAGCSSGVTINNGSANLLKICSFYGTNFVLLLTSFIEISVDKFSALPIVFTTVS